MEGATSRYDVVDLARSALERSLAAAEGRTLAARLILSGTTAVHGALAAAPDSYTNEIRLAAGDLAGHVYLERIVVATSSTVDLARVRAQDDAIGQLARAIDAMKNDPSAHDRLAKELADLVQRLPLKLREGESAIGLDGAGMAELLGDVESLLLPLLLSGERTP
jgi:DNA repair protein SbcD/Mre11